MKWFFRWLYNGLKTVENEPTQENVNWSDHVGLANGLVPRRIKKFTNSTSVKMASDDNHIHLSQSSMNFRLYPATGGHIVEYSYYDEKKDQNTQALHLITSDQDLGDSLSKIMTLEALRR